MLKTVFKDYRASLSTALVVVTLALAVAAAPPEKAGSERGGAGNSQTQVEDSGREHLLPGAAESVEDLILLEKKARSLPPLEATPDEGLIAELTAENLELRHYRRQRFDDEVSSRFLERYIDSLDNLHLLDAPTLVIAGARDPLVRISRAFVLAELPHVTAVKVPGAHALNFTSPELIAELVEAHLAGRPVLAGPLARHVAELVEVYDTAPLQGGADGISPR